VETDEKELAKYLDFIDIPRQAVSGTMIGMTTTKTIPLLRIEQ